MLYVCTVSKFLLQSTYVRTHSVHQNMDADQIAAMTQSLMNNVEFYTQIENMVGRYKAAKDTNSSVDLTADIESIANTAISVIAADDSTPDVEHAETHSA